MVAFLVESFWRPARYRVRLTNRGSTTLTDFRLGFSGPARIRADAVITNGQVVARRSSWCEMAPPEGLALAPGESWTVEASGFDEDLQHWTDGTTAAFVILADGSTRDAEVLPTRLEGDETPLRTGPAVEDAPVPEGVSISVVPWPADVSVNGRRTPPAGFALDARGGAAGSAAQAFASLTASLFAGESLVLPEKDGGMPVALVEDERLLEESYAVAFGAEAVLVRASTHAGFLYGLITLGQILRGARMRAEELVFPAEGRVRDAPRYGWRGCHLDVARRFYPEGDVAQFLRIMAWNKLNRFHWHLSDDEGWRVEIDAFPALTEIAAWRGYGMAVPPLLGTGAARHGGFYSKDAVRRLVVLAGELGIDIVPEIDMPGHCYAMLEALPQLRDPNEVDAYYSIQEFPNNCLNPAVPEVMEAVTAILDELAGLFPSRWFHVGADEVPKDAWTGSPLARDMLRRVGGAGPADLQAVFLRQVQAHLRGRGKVTGAWEEAAEGGGIDASDCYLVGWHTIEGSRALAGQGYDVVVAPGQAYYLDMANGPDWAEPGAHWAGWSSPETTYAFVPDDGWSEAERARLLGVQACIWSEPTTKRDVFQRLVFPRLSAIAETGWSFAQTKSWPRFAALSPLMPVL